LFFEIALATARTAPAAKVQAQTQAQSYRRAYGGIVLPFRAVALEKG